MDEESRRRARALSPAGWLKERLLEAFAVDVEPDAKKRKVLDLFVAPGRIVGKVQEDGGRSRRFEIDVRQLTDSEWQQVTKHLAESLILLSRLLAGAVPAELDERLRRVGVRMVPSSDEEISVSVGGSTVDRSDETVKLLMTRVAERIHADPFLLFVLRGRGREETLFEVDALRRARAEEELTGIADEREQSRTDEAKVPRRRVSDDIWRMGRDVFELSYSIRADELPALILKRLDPLPLGGLEEDVEPLLEESYVRIARRAHAYGFGMK